MTKSNVPFDKLRATQCSISNEQEDIRNKEEEETPAYGQEEHKLLLRVSVSEPLEPDEVLELERNVLKGLVRQINEHGLVPGDAEGFTQHLQLGNQHWDMSYAGVISRDYDLGGSEPPATKTLLEFYYSTDKQKPEQGPVEVECKNTDLATIARACALHYWNYCDGEWEEYDTVTFHLFDSKKKLLQADVDVHLDGDPVFEPDIENL